jgi:translation machinery-associated protein 16
MVWFKYAIDPDVECYSDMAAIHELIQMYIERNQEEIGELRKLHRKGQPRPKASREDMIIAVAEKDNLEYDTGFGTLITFECV